MTTPSATKLLLSVEDAADFLGVSRSTMYDLMRTRAIASVRIGRCRRISLDALRTYVDHLPAQTVNPSPGHDGSADGQARARRRLDLLARGATTLGSDGEPRLRRDRQAHPKDRVRAYQDWGTHQAAWADPRHRGWPRHRRGSV